MARNIINSEIQEMRENGFYIPNDRLDWEDMLKVMYYNDEGLTPIEIAYKIGCNTDVICYVKFNGFNCNERLYTWAEIKKVSRKFYDEINID